MLVTKENGVLSVKGSRYALTFAADRPFVYVDDAAGNRLLELFPLSGVNPLHGRDDTVRIGTWTAEESGGEVVAALAADSSVWTRKTFRFRCAEDRFRYEAEVEGEGRPAEVNYFGGYYSGHIRWGSGFFWSGQRLRRGFNPEPNGQEANYFAPAEGSVIDLTGVPLPGKGDWFFTPPPFCFAFETESGWLGIGVEAEPGRNRYTELFYRGQQQFGFHLSLAFEGHTEVSGVYELPAIGFDFAENEYAALHAHVEALRQNGYVPARRGGDKPAWWYEPIFCGWGSQCYVAAVEQGHAPSYARQQLYDGFMAALDAHGVTPGIVVLDDKWQAAYGENIADTGKWPDLRGFVDLQHAAGKKVLLWLKAWDPEGVPAEECIRNAAGLPLAFDPTNPAFEARLRARCGACCLPSRERTMRTASKSTSARAFRAAPASALTETRGDWN
ncbi:hypothetical protein SD70_26955 [Gordoniibacillus kamchatkensis]|uniref:Alpha-glucosidase n=1 Tax=Gordoniibacillus kamchatkensis TaxID=1590651 RepID=A0ABR5ABL4_9BACL|nr:hypothetical protein [Paenibacillus sp. VKM B-2647]KIL38361.1 hypothetical protein SD70_26955 [Paenibacillus sp. VKM B-2647]